MGNCMTSRNCAHDGNHKQMVAAARALGYEVLDLSRVGGGCPDTLVSKGYFGCLVEIKQVKGKVSLRQKLWMERWAGLPCVVVRTVEELTEVLHEQEALYRKAYRSN